MAVVRFFAEVTNSPFQGKRIASTSIKTLLDYVAEDHTCRNRFLGGHFPASLLNTGDILFTFPPGSYPTPEKKPNLTLAKNI
jgi:hypothetical protein